MVALGAFLAGAAMGMLTGLLVGLSSSPVVGAVLAGLVALLVTFFGFRSPDAAEPSKHLRLAQQRRDDLRRALTVAGFGAFGVLGALLGIYLRAHDTMALSPGDRVARWREAGFDPARARALATFELTGIVPRGDTVLTPQRAAGSGGVLFSGDRDTCDRIDAESLSEASGMIAAFSGQGGRWKEVAESVAEVPEQRQKQILLSAWRLVCTPP